MLYSNVPLRTQLTTWIAVIEKIAIFIWYIIQPEIYYHIKSDIKGTWKLQCRKI